VPTATLDDAEAEWSMGVDVPPPRITRGAAAFGAAGQPTVTKTKRGNFASRHPIVLVALYATAGIALVVIGVSVISSGSFRASGSPAGERTAEVKVKPSPVPTAVHTPAATPKPTATPAPTPDAAALKAKQERAAWLRERRNGHRDEGRAVDNAREQARLAERRRAQRKRSKSAATPTPIRTVQPTPAPRPVVRPQPRPQPPPCEFCIG
jgi:cell division protein FtsN